MSSSGSGTSMARTSRPQCRGRFDRGLLLLGGRDLLLLPTLYAVRLDHSSDRTRLVVYKIAVIGW